MTAPPDLPPDALAELPPRWQAAFTSIAATPLGRPTCAPEVAETNINEDPCVTCGRSGTCNIFFCYGGDDR